MKLDPGEFLPTRGGSYPSFERSLPKLDTDVGFFDRAGEFLSRPETRHTLARVGQAIAPHSPGIQMLGELGANMATVEVYEDYKEALRSGGDKTEESFSILPIEIRQQAFKETLDERNMALEGRRVGALEEYYKDLGTQAIAQAAGTPPWEEKFEHQLELAGLKQDGIKNTWMSVGQGKVFNWLSGETKALYDWQTGQGSDPKTQQRMWYNTARREALESLEREGYGNIVQDREGNVTFKWNKPDEAEQVYTQTLEEVLRKYQTQGVLPPGFMGTQIKPKIEY